MVDREDEEKARVEVREGNNGRKNEEEEVKDLEKGEVGFEEERVVQNKNEGNENHHHNVKNHEEFPLSRFNRLNPTNPLRIVVNNATRVASPSLQPPPPAAAASAVPPPPQSEPSQPRSIPTPQPLVSFFTLKLTC